MTAGVTLSAFAYEWYIDGDPAAARNAAFSVLVIEELLRSFSMRSDTRTVWEVGLLSNMQLCVIVVASFALQLAIHHLPALQVLFGTSPISLGQCAAWVGLGAIPLFVLELRKVVRRSRAVHRAVGEAAV
jgi:Ca2+-transporting ATPase